MVFEIIGYSLDYIVDGKYIGSRTIKEKDRDHCGYRGRKTFVTADQVLLNKGKTIKSGTLVTTELNEINGRMK